jgi:hypothetical protein
MESLYLLLQSAINLAQLGLKLALWLKLVPPSLAVAVAVRTILHKVEVPTQPNHQMLLPRSRNPFLDR